jgi:hypothetical protein
VGVVILEIRNRIVEFKNVDSSNLLDHESNFRVHPKVQQNMMKGILEDIGISGALVAYYSERNDGKLTIIDGHLRKNMGGEWPVCITDLNDSEADKLLAVHDPVGMLAVADDAKLSDLRSRMDEFSKSIADGMNELFGEYSDETPVEKEVAPKTDGDDDKIPEMELQPYEHYDYVLVLARKTMDWMYLVDRLGLKTEEGSPDARYSKVGLGRAIPAERLIDILKDADRIIQEKRDGGGD